MNNKLYIKKDNSDSTYFFPYGKYNFDKNLSFLEDRETLIYSWFYDEIDIAKRLQPVGSGYNKEIIVFYEDNYYFLDQHYSLKENFQLFSPLSKKRVEEIILKYGDLKLYPFDFYLFKNKNF
jgi:hypothetical protein